MSGAILKATSGDGWPFPDVANDYRDGANAWRSINEARWWHFLEVLPPINYPGGFMVSEPYSHDSRGVPVYLACVKCGNGVFAARLVPRDQASNLTSELLQSRAAPTRLDERD